MRHYSENTEAALLALVSGMIRLGVRHKESPSAKERALFGRSAGTNILL